ncbi:hypothetical protein KBC75_02755 [Candidatus Shapirobacteria bacterium]|nr:hypothetical protein [Candidatus Shapirobacteria bacterium]
MSLKNKSSTQFTFQSLIRLIIFGVLIYFLVVYLASNTPHKTKTQSDPTVLGTEVTNLSQKAYQSLPQKSRDALQNLPSSPVIIQAQANLNKLGGISAELPNKIIIEVKKVIVKSIYDNIMKDLESKK